MNQQQILGDPPVPDIQSEPPSDATEAAVGVSIVIRGEVSGDEDLTVHGRIEGSVNLPKNRVIVGEQGRIQANIHARSVVVHGSVDGDIRGDEHVAVSRSGHVEGNISAPRVSLEDGSRFRGAIDMDVKPEVRKGITKPIMMPTTDRG